jgi:hypothetical protein
MARCPAHEDKGPSLSIRETDDGRVLVHCFSGCGTTDVVASLGLSLADLFDKPLTPSGLPPIRGGFSARELLELLAHEATVAAILTSDAEGRALTDQEHLRLAQAAGRLNEALGMIHGR